MLTSLRTVEIVNWLTGLLRGYLTPRLVRPPDPATKSIVDQQHAFTKEPRHSDLAVIYTVVVAFLWAGGRNENQ
jgi:hypothetical protein